MKMETLFWIGILLCLIGVFIIFVCVVILFITNFTK
jgi:uncharacterized membrane protein